MQFPLRTYHSLQIIPCEACIYVRHWNKRQLWSFSPFWKLLHSRVMKIPIVQIRRTMTNIMSSFWQFWSLGVWLWLTMYSGAEVSLTKMKLQLTLRFYYLPKLYQKKKMMELSASYSQSNGNCCHQVTTQVMLDLHHKAFFKAMFAAK